MRDDRERLKDILEAIEHIEKYAAKGRAVFELIQIWFLQYLQIIGEASRALSANIRESHPEVPWTKIIGMRNILVHNYFEIDLPVVWNAVERELPELKRQLTSMIKELGEA